MASTGGKAATVHHKTTNKVAANAMAFQEMSITDIRFEQAINEYNEVMGIAPGGPSLPGEVAVAMLPVMHLTGAHIQTNSMREPSSLRSWS